MERPRLRVLLIEDDEDDYILVRDLLKAVSPPRYELRWVRDYDTAMEALQNCEYDICLLDYRLGEHNGLELMEKASKSRFKAPIIFLTGQGDYETDLEAMKAGAADYLLKHELNAALLERAIRYSVGRKQVEEELRESEERFRFLAENTRDALYRLKFDSMTYDYLSPAIETLTGYSLQEIENAGFSTLVTRIDLPWEEDISPEKIAEDRRSGNIGEFLAEYRIIKKNGDVRWLRDRSSPWRDESGMLIGSVGVLSDVTERKQAEEALRDSEKRLRFLSAKLLTLQEKERANLAHELHDRIGQTLVAIKVNVEHALGTSENEDLKAIPASLLKPLIPMIQNAVDEVRKIYMSLRPTVLDDLGIVAAVQYLCREFEDIYPTIHIDKEIGVRPGDVPDNIGIVIYRILQEALNNVASHSSSNTVYISLVKEADTLRLSIRDNGMGFDVKQILGAENRERSLGIAGMKERIELSSGSFAIDSMIGEGTTVRAWWPGKNCNS